MTGPWTDLGMRHKAELNWPLLGVLAADGLLWIGILTVVVPFLSKIHV